MGRECNSHLNFGLECHCLHYVREFFSLKVLIISNFFINNVLVNVLLMGVDLNVHLTHPFSVLVPPSPYSLQKLFRFTNTIQCSVIVTCVFCKLLLCVKTLFPVLLLLEFINQFLYNWCSLSC